jgi:T3SS negative regulator,GrlR
MVEGLWTVQFHGPQGNGGGVVVLVRNQVLGGDSGFAYVGNYEFNIDTLKARVQVKNFGTEVPNALGVFGNLELLIDAKMQGDSINGIAALASAPDTKMVVRLKKFADLK